MNLKLFKMVYLHFSNPYSRSIMVAFTAFFLTLGITYLLWSNTHDRLIILAGLPISFLVLLTILSFSHTAEQARALARKMTSEIRNLNAELENMINTAPNPIIVHTEDGTIVKIQSDME